MLGSGFIGIETASHFKLALKDAVDIQVVSQGNTVYGAVLGETVGKAMQQICEEGGLKFTFG